MRASAFVLIASIVFPLMPAHATPLAYDFGGQNSHLYNRAQLTRFADDRGYHVVDLSAITRQLMAIHCLRAPTEAHYSLLRGWNYLISWRPLQGFPVGSLRGTSPLGIS